jgi:glutathione S-transferase
LPTRPLRCSILWWSGTYAGNFVRLRELQERDEISFEEYPNVAAWMERLESRDSYEAAV